MKMRMTTTRGVLDTLPKRSAVVAAEKEVAHAEDLANMLRAVVEGFWQAGQYSAGQSEYRAMMRTAESLLTKVGG
jgi:protein-disulfide isomerase-like protein with CxxC motif